MTLPPFLNLRRLAVDPYRTHNQWAIRCTGCRNSFYAQGGDRGRVETQGLVHIRNDHGGSHA